MGVLVGCSPSELRNVVRIWTIPAFFLTRFRRHHSDRFTSSASGRSSVVRTMLPLLTSAAIWLPPPFVDCVGRGALDISLDLLCTFMHLCLHTDVYVDNTALTGSMQNSKIMVLSVPRRNL